MELTPRERAMAAIANRAEQQRQSEIAYAKTLTDDPAEAAARAEDEATETAKASPAPGIEGIDKNVWADGGAAWRN